MAHGPMNTQGARGNLRSAITYRLMSKVARVPVIPVEKFQPFVRSILSESQDNHTVIEHLQESVKVRLFFGLL